ncbi:pentapeptide repeat-containing protein [Nocardia sp. NPDC046763]|uniref:pentapeptide repeat-containing protein n=1 Tax=Nocardia sp. NPDC046763 TaxID=3155256 RepID=UPI0033C2137C
MFGFDLRRRRDRAERSRLDRFDTATAHLGADDASDRIAGVRAMADLADEWDWRGRQDCIDSLCGYLRAYRQDDQDVRRTITRVISARLQADGGVHWSAHDFQFRGATLEDVDFRGAVFGSADFEGVKFCGTANFARTTFYETPSFVLAEFDGNADFSDATFDWVSFQHVLDRPVGAEQCPVRRGLRRVTRRGCRPDGAHASQRHCRPGLRAR